MEATSNHPFPAQVLIFGGVDGLCMMYFLRFAMDQCAFASVVGPANLAHNFAFRRRFSSRKDDNIQTALVLLAVVGACYLLYHLGVALYQFARTGLPHAVDNVRSANRDVRRRIAERWRVVDRDPRREEGPPS